MQQNTQSAVVTEKCFAFWFAFSVMIEDIGCNSNPITVKGTSALTAKSNIGSQYSNDERLHFLHATLIMSLILFLAVL